jgi:hypothetical protein
MTELMNWCVGSVTHNTCAPVPAMIGSPQHIIHGIISCYTRLMFWCLVRLHVVHIDIALILKVLTLKILSYSQTDFLTCSPLNLQLTLADPNIRKVSVRPWQHYIHLRATARSRTVYFYIWHVLLQQDGIRVAFHSSWNFPVQPWKYSNMSLFISF